MTGADGIDRDGAQHVTKLVAFLPGGFPVSAATASPRASAAVATTITTTATTSVNQPGVAGSQRLAQHDDAEHRCDHRLGDRHRGQRRGQRAGPKR